MPTKMATRSRPPAAQGSERPVSGLARGRTFLPNVPPSQIQRPSGLRYDTALTVAGAAPGWQLLASPVSRFTLQQCHSCKAPFGRLRHFRAGARSILTLIAPQHRQLSESSRFNLCRVDPGADASYSSRHGSQYFSAGTKARSADFAAGGVSCAKRRFTRAFEDCRSAQRAARNANGRSTQQT